MAYKKKEAAKDSGVIKNEVNIELENDLIITSIDVRMVNKGNLIASVSITINDCLVIRDCLVTTYKDNLYFNFPQGNYTGSDKKEVYYNKVFPIIKGTRAKINEAVIDTINKIK